MSHATADGDRKPSVRDGFVIRNTSGALAPRFFHELFRRQHDGVERNRARACERQVVASLRARFGRLASDRTSESLHGPTRSNAYAPNAYTPSTLAFLAHMATNAATGMGIARRASKPIVTRKGRPASARCARCSHKPEQHVDRDGRAVCVVCDLSTASGPCANAVLAREPSIDARVDG